MAYGGPAIGAPAAPSASNIRQIELEKECELRIEVGLNSPLRLRLLSGTAEIFGSEIPPEIWVTYPPRLKFAVFTCYGAKIEMDGITETEYTADETPMITYVNVHAVLDARRNRAKAAPPDSDDSKGPRVFVVGPTDSGKSTLTKMLLSWAAKQGWKPTYVDLDISQGSITIPGCIAAAPVKRPIDPVEGVPMDMHLAYFYGHATPSVNVELYKVLVKELAQVVDKQLAGNAESRAAGIVINTMGWIEGIGYELLLQAIDAFNANVVFVLGQRCIRLKSCIRKYLTAFDEIYLLGVAGRRATQTSPSQVADYSLFEWEPVRDGVEVKLRTATGHFLRANGGLPPIRNSVTHDTPRRSVTHEWILWDVEVVDSVNKNKHPHLLDDERHTLQYIMSSPRSKEAEDTESPRNERMMWWR
ncbi:unnamed protein product [Rhodiola kirilowii]